MSIVTWEFESPPLHYILNKKLAEIAQLVEHDLAKVGVEGPSPFSRSKEHRFIRCFFAFRKGRGTEKRGRTDAD